MIKKLISILLAAVILMSSLGCSLVVFAANSVSVDSFINSVEELNEEESEAEKSFDESVGSRVIVKSLQKPAVYGNAEYIKGTYGKYIFQYSTEEEALDAVDYYQSLSYVKWVERDQVITTQDTSHYGTAMLGTQRASEYIASHNIPTSSIKVAVIDTGIDFNHKLFKDNPRIIDSGLNVTDSGKKDSALDDRKHGSEVAEIIMDNTSEDVSIIGYKVLNVLGSGTDLWIATGIEKAIEDGVDIINLSLGGELYPNTVETSEVFVDAVELAISKGVIVVGAAGNDGLAAEHFVPACIDGVIAVGAIDKAGNRAYFSNYGEEVDFVAPGVDVERDYVVETYYTYENGKKVSHTDSGDPISGTSFSSPYIAAEIATLKTVYPKITSQEAKSMLANVCVPYEHLPYHDGFHPINEDRGVFHEPLYMNDWCGDIDDLSVCYGYGMPQVDLLFEMPDGFNRTTTPSFSVKGGHYIDEEFDLILSSETDSEIYYTQDESYPTKENGIKYEGSIHLDELQSVRAVAFSEGKAPSYFSAEEYRMEYHVPESDFNFVNQKVVTDVAFHTKYYYYNVLTEYTGTRKNIILPETYNGIKVDTAVIHTTNVHLTSVTVPDSITKLLNGYNKSGQDIVWITANGVDEINCQGDKYPSLVHADIDSATQIWFFNTNIREVIAPKAVELNCQNCPCLKNVSAPILEVAKIIGGGGCFADCYSLHNIYCPNLKIITIFGFRKCYMLTNFTFENVEEIHTDALSFTFRIKELNLPKLTLLTKSLIGSGVKSIFAPKLEKIEELFGNWQYIDETGEYCIGYRSRIILSSAFNECLIDGEGYKNKQGTIPPKQFFFHYLLDIYGTPNTYAEEYANKFNLKFVPLPLLESEPESMRASDSLSVDVLGFNLEYQWYGTNIADNRTGVAIEGANAETFNPDDFGADYDFYYCVIKSSDGDYHKTLVTGDRIRLDVNGDGYIDIADVSVLLSLYGRSPQADFQDFNKDGVIDISEIGILLMENVYGKAE